MIRVTIKLSTWLPHSTSPWPQNIPLISQLNAAPGRRCKTILRQPKPTWAWEHRKTSRLQRTTVQIEMSRPDLRWSWRWQIYNIFLHTHTPIHTCCTLQKQIQKKKKRKSLCLIWKAWQELRVCVAVNQGHEPIRKTYSIGAPRWMAPLKVAIIGGGPLSFKFYVASCLLSLFPKDEPLSSQLKTHIYDRLWAPHSLVWYGIVPDHPEVSRHSFPITPTLSLSKLFSSPIELCTQV